MIANKFLQSDQQTAQKNCSKPQQLGQFEKLYKSIEKDSKDIMQWQGRDLNNPELRNEGELNAIR